MTLYNNSFGFMSWVVYTLCVPRDNHGATTESGSYFYRGKASSLFTLFTTRRRRCLRRTRERHGSCACRRYTRSRTPRKLVEPPSKYRRLSSPPPPPPHPFPSRLSREVIVAVACWRFVVALEISPRAASPRDLRPTFMSVRSFWRRSSMSSLSELFFCSFLFLFQSWNPRLRRETYVISNA